MNALTIGLISYAAFTVGVVCGAVLICMLQAAKRRARILTARHLRRNDYGNRWSQPFPVSDPLQSPSLNPSHMGREERKEARATQIGGDHYRSKTIQPWDAMEEWLSAEQFKGFLRGNVIKYMARCDDKGGIEDIKKADHYLTKLLEREG